MANEAEVQEVQDGEYYNGVDGVIKALDENGCSGRASRLFVMEWQDSGDVNFYDSTNGRFDKEKYDQVVAAFEAFKATFGTDQQADQPA